MLREKYGYCADEFLLIYAAEFIHRKNHRFIIDALPQLIKEIPHIKVLFAGTGKILDKIITYARTGHREMINQGVNSYMYPQNEQQKFIEHIVHLHQNPIIRQQMSQAAITTIQKCSVDNALKSMAEIYGKFV